MFINDLLRENMTHYYSRESKTVNKNFTVMEVIPGKPERLVCRTPRGDVAAHIVTQLNRSPLPVKPEAPVVQPRFKVGDILQHTFDKTKYLILSETECWGLDCKKKFVANLTSPSVYTFYTKVNV